MKEGRLDEALRADFTIGGYIFYLTCEQVRKASHVYTLTELDPELVDRLADIPNIVGIKDSSGNLDTLNAYAEIAKKKDFSLLVGSDSKISYAYGIGAVAAVAGTSNVIVDTLVGLDKALREGNTAEAEKLQKDIDVLRGVLGLGTVPSVMKRATELAGIAEIGPARMPVQKLSAEDDEKIKEMLKYYNLYR